MRRPCRLMGTKQCGGCHEENAQALDLDYGLAADAARTYAIIALAAKKKADVVIVADTRKLDGPSVLVGGDV